MIIQIRQPNRRYSVKLVISRLWPDLSYASLKKNVTKNCTWEYVPGERTADYCTSYKRSIQKLPSGQMSNNKNKKHCNP